MERLNRALETILACPECKASLALSQGEDRIICKGCRQDFPIQNGIPLFLSNKSLLQRDEKEFRDNLAAGQSNQTRDDLIRTAGEHHCIPVMKHHADRFRAHLSSHEWLLDVGIGYGWHWRKPSVSWGTVIGVDMSLGNLLLAQKVLDTSSNVLLVCADAARLPIRDNAISAVWSVQTLQHFPKAVFDHFLDEMNRILKPNFRAECYNLHPAALYRGIYSLFRKHLHRSGFTGNMELQRLCESEWIGKWKPFRTGQVRIHVNYSELFFHPDFHMRPDPYPVKIEGEV